MLGSCVYITHLNRKLKAYVYLWLILKLSMYVKISSRKDHVYEVVIQKLRVHRSFSQDEIVPFASC